MKFQVRRKTVMIEYGTIEADSHAQAADMLRANMWGDTVSPDGDKTRYQQIFTVNGLPVRTATTDEPTC